MDIKLFAIACLFVPLEFSSNFSFPTHLPEKDLFDMIGDDEFYEEEEEPEFIPISIDFSKFKITTTFDSSKSYQSTLNAIKKSKTTLIVTNMDSLSDVFTDALLNKIIPYWYGTPWDFEGHTAVPNQGEIACGYFVSTTLKHMGVNLNRYKMAQQAALLEIKSIDSDYYKCIGCEAEDFFTDFKSKMDDGIYIIGLDNHVGYLLKRNEELFFIHSDYINDKVNIEIAHTSQALIYSESFYVGKLSGNVDFLKKWLNGTQINIITTL